MFSPLSPLPAFRSDLLVSNGPEEEDGSPTYQLFDPLSAQYVKLHWEEYQIIQHHASGMNSTQLSQRLYEKTTLIYRPEEIVSLFQQAYLGNLLECFQGNPKSPSLTSSLLSFFSFLSSCLFLPIPLFCPDRFLTKTLSFVRFFFSAPFFFLYACIITVGFFLLLVNWEAFIHTLPLFFNQTGLLIYSISIIGIKILHEFGHAYVAKNFGIPVRSMGVMLILFWPLLYSDITDSWKLTSRAQRLWITSAGCLVELLLAGFSIFGWLLSEDGLWKSLFFILASSSWISTLLVNINPCMRFDGYYLLSDLLKVDNLRQRSFQLTLNKMRQIFFGIELPREETRLSPLKRRILICYSIAAWIYRFFLYTGIVLIIYKKFTKIIGLLLAIIEIGFLFIYPISKEIKNWMRMKSRFRATRSVIILWSIIGLFFAWFVVPLPHHHKISALCLPLEEQVIFSPLSGQVDYVYKRKADGSVKKGEILLRVTPFPLLNKIERITKEKELVEQELYLLQESEMEEGTTFILAKQAELFAKQEQLIWLEKQKAQSEVTASMAGKVYSWDSSIKQGNYIKKDDVIGKMSSSEKSYILGWVDERDLNKITVSMNATFVDYDSGEKRKGKIVSIQPVNTRTLAYPQAASLFGGDLPVLRKQGELTLVGSFYEVKMELNDPKLALPFGKTGKIKIRTRFFSLLGEWLRKITATFWKESTF